VTAARKTGASKTGARASVRSILRSLIAGAATAEQENVDGPRNAD
jgi:hypothetical protein